MTEPAVRLIAVADVVVAGNRRPLRDLAPLMQSIERVGLLNPITVTDDLGLVAGYHRLEACRRLGLTEIAANLVTLDLLDRELAEIDENLVRHELTVIEQGEQLARREEILRLRGQRAAPGWNGNQWTLGGETVSPPMFPDDAPARPAPKTTATVAREAGFSERSAQQRKQVAISLAPDVRTAIIEAHQVSDKPESSLANSTGTLLKLARLAPEAQEAVLERAPAIEPKAVEDAIREVKREIERAQPRVALVAELPARIEVIDATQPWPLADDTVDLLVTSPPYGLEVAYAGIPDLADGWADFMEAWLGEAYRVARDSGRLAVNVPLDTTEGGHRPTYAETVVAARQAGWQYRFTLVWDEQNVSKSLGRGSVDSPSAPHCYAPVEMIAVFFKGAVWRRASDVPPDISHEEWLAWTGVGGIWRFGGESRPWEQHPAPFPEELPYRLIRLLSFPGDTVLDPFLGSGSTVVVAHRLGRDAIGFDQSAEYVDSARRRLQQSIESE